jgi:hypothetical protein
MEEFSDIPQKLLIISNQPDLLRKLQRSSSLFTTSRRFFSESASLTSSAARTTRTWT